MKRTVLTLAISVFLLSGCAFYKHFNTSRSSMATYVGNIDLSGLFLPSIHDAAARGDSSAVQAIIRNGGHDAVTKTNAAGETPLHLAAKNDRANVTAILVEKGADLNAEDNNKKTALDVAYAARAYTAVEVLVANNARIDRANAQTILEELLERGLFNGAKTMLRKKYTARQFDADRVYLEAVRRGDTDMITFALSANANLRDAADGRGNTALMIASGLKDNATAKFIWGKTGDAKYVNRENQAGDSAFTIAMDAGQTELAKLYVTGGANVNAKNGAILFDAAKKKNYDLLKFFFANGGNPRIADDAIINLAYRGNDATLFGILLDRGNMNPMMNDGFFYIDACRSGKLDIVQLMVSRGAGVNALNGEPLVTAASNGQEAVVKYLLDNKANINIRSGEALTAAYRARQTKVVKLLLDRGASSSMADEQIFLTAVDSGDADLAKLMLDRGTDPNAQMSRALITACSKGNADIVKLLVATKSLVIPEEAQLVEKAIKAQQLKIARMLIERGAAYSITPLDILLASCRYNNPMLARLAVTKGANVNDITTTPLVVACDAKSIETVSELLALKANVNIDDGKPLLVAWRGGNIPLVKLLLERGANVNANEGELLVSACAAGNVDAVKLALANNADVNIRAGAPLINAFTKRNMAIVVMLIEKGANVNVSGGELMLAACREGNTQLATLLIKRGADVNILNGEPLAIVCSNNATAFISLLVTNKARVDVRDGKLLVTLASKGNADAVELFLAYGANPNVENGAPLITACEQNSESVAALLVKKGADVNVRAGRPLITACTARNLALVSLLLQAGADPNADSGAPIIIASKNGDVPIATKLLEKKASLTAHDDKQRTPVDIAYDIHHADLVRLYNATNEAPARLFTAAKTLSLADARFLLLLGADTTLRDENNMTALMYAASASVATNVPTVSEAAKRQTEFVALLVDKGSDVLAKTKSGEISYDLFLKAVQPLEQTLRRELDESLSSGRIGKPDILEVFTTYNRYRNRTADMLLAPLRNR
ncbi:MAG: ankyrin repeat domain-containing protein [Spirochaetes bacterium]|nr:ankyrin repeat domain-containing protein [Spirochaetota bacterium]